MTSHAPEASGHITPATSAATTMRNFRDEAGRIWTSEGERSTGGVGVTAHRTVWWSFTTSAPPPAAAWQCSPD